jgi:hypothetical protein
MALIDTILPTQMLRRSRNTRISSVMGPIAVEAVQLHVLVKGRRRLLHNTRFSVHCIILGVNGGRFSDYLFCRLIILPVVFMDFIRDKEIIAA